MHRYDIRPALTEDDRAAVFHLRYELYVQEQGLFGDVADHERRWLRDAMDDHAAIWIARVGDEVVGTGRFVHGPDGRFDEETRHTFDLDTFAGVVDERTILVGSRMLVRAAHRGGMLPVMIIARAFEQAIDRGFELMVGECEPHLVNAWLRLGFRPYGLCEHPINGTLVRVAYVLGDKEHVRRIDSPLASVIDRYPKDDELPRRLREAIRSSQKVISEAEGRTRFFETIELAVARVELAQRLGGLTDEELETLLDNGHALDCDPGAMLIRKGHVSRTLYVLLTGTLVVRDEGKVIVELTAPGEILGEVAFFTDGERMSDVLAGHDGARVLALSERSLKTLVANQGTGAAKFLLSMTRGLCHKLRQRGRVPSEVATQLGLRPVEG
ncbi:cyclic nucleotide-binding domain-containing protein [Paraliomyxa miuraensis]|uniref:cyclic nucleotide-binding domain-containing protein n=1 Tax=Paraliomyxa miuraensis TaxID=376150 RepID=UPI00225A7CD7|nr:cyclic nucleotide-binding domain-containing protein [Paraliomyxa miuraensis]MCX4246785.1 cyclic nucleotide-binding domain-containing protein [Paraliomyxa miuraensis]